MNQKIILGTETITSSIISKLNPNGLLFLWLWESGKMRRSLGHLLWCFFGIVFFELAAAQIGYF